jgi:hypothetical protein
MLWSRRSVAAFVKAQRPTDPRAWSQHNESLRGEVCSEIESGLEQFLGPRPGQLQFADQLFE